MTKYQVFYKNEGHEFMIQFLNETAKDNFVQTLINSGLNYNVKTVCSPDKYQVTYAAFSIEDVSAILAGKKHPYIFADPEKYSTGSKVVRVQLEELENGKNKEKDVIVIDTAIKTVKEIFDIAHNLGRKKLCRVINKIL